MVRISIFFPSGKGGGGKSSDWPRRLLGACAVLLDSFFLHTGELAGLRAAKVAVLVVVTVASGNF